MIIPFLSRGSRNSSTGIVLEYKSQSMYARAISVGALGLILYGAKGDLGVSAQVAADMSMKALRSPSRGGWRPW
jgi:hypothetical protein